jgi:hypothetical protein
MNLKHTLFRKSLNNFGVVSLTLQFKFYDSVTVAMFINCCSLLPDKLLLTSILYSAPALEEIISQFSLRVI